MKESKMMVKKEIGFMKKKGAPKSMIKHEMKEAGMKKMMGGGMGYAKGGETMKKMAAGGSASKRADGIAAKGKTKGTIVKMRMGGKACK
jgi:hypothetical protein